MQKNTPFRTWLHELWIQNCDEHIAFKESPLSKEEYFQKYKYWLKREFKYQQRIINE